MTNAGTRAKRRSFNPSGRPLSADPKAVTFPVRMTAAEKAALEQTALAAGISVGRLMVESALARAGALTRSHAVIETISALGRELNAFVRCANAGDEPDPDQVAQVAQVVRQMEAALESDIIATDALVAALTPCASLIRQWLKHQPQDIAAAALIERINEIVG